MRRIYLNFVGRMLRANLKVFFASVLGAVIVHRMGYPGASVVFGALLFGMAFQGGSLVNGHVTLLQGFPYTRKKLLLFIAATNWTAGAIALFFICLYLFFLNFLLATGPEKVSDRTLWEHLRGLPYQSIAHDLARFASMPGVFGGLLAAFSLLVGFTFTSWPSGMIRLSPTATVSGREQLKAAAISLGLIAYFLYAVSFSPYLLYAGAFAAISLAIYTLVSVPLVVPTARRRKLGSILAGFAVAQGVLLLVVSYAATNSLDSERRLSALTILGTLGPRADAALVASLAEHPMSPDDLRDLKELFRPSVWESRPSTIDGLPPYGTLIRNQKYPEVLEGLAELYPAEKLGDLDLLALLAKQEETKEPRSSWSSIPGARVWLQVSLEEETISRLLVSENSAHAAFALRYATLRPRARYLEPILTALQATAPADLLPEGVAALSNAIGRPLTLRSYQAQLKPGARNEFYRPDCAALSLDKLRSFEKSSDEPLFNRCLKELSLRTGRSLANVPAWVKLPMSKKEKNRLLR